jgi:DNA primase
MENAALLVLVESVLGKGQVTSKGNYAFKCPFCNHHKQKLEVSLRTTAKKENMWHCWVCDAKGKTIRQLFKRAKATPDKFKDLSLLIVPSANEEHVTTDALVLPAEFIAFNAHSTFVTDRVAQIESKHALRFLKKRGVTIEDITKYNIGFCKDGPYAGRIIIPSYDSNGILNYFTARAYKDSDRKYKNPPVASKDVIGFELYINWDAPLILCEGMFDAITIKRNCIPLLGKVLHNKLMEKIVKSSVDRIYIALDNDAKKDALKHAEKLMSYGKEVYMVELEGKDANEIGFESFLNTLEQTEPLTFQSLLEKKLQNI